MSDPGLYTPYDRISIEPSIERIDQLVPTAVPTAEDHYVAFRDRLDDIVRDGFAESRRPRVWPWIALGALIVFLVRR